MKFQPMMIGHEYVRDADPGETYPELTERHFHQVGQEWPLYSISTIKTRGGMTIGLNIKRSMDAWWAPCSLSSPLPLQLIPELLKLTADTMLELAQVESVVS